MPPSSDTKTQAVAGETQRRLAYFNAGFLTQTRIRLILALAGYDLTLFKPGAQDQIGVWGHTRYAERGEAVAAETGAALVRIEDAFLRSLRPGRAGEPPIGLLIDRQGMHYDPRQPSELETLLATHPLDDTHLLNRARACIERLQEADLSKYSAHDPDAPLPAPGYVLVIDQTKGDASVTQGGADANAFREMLYYAQEENPGAPIVIKTHPETAQGFRPGYFSANDLRDGITVCDAPVSPWRLLAGAVKVYVVSSQMGFEAILAGHRPRVFGKPFYAGWGLSDDLHEIPRRTRTLTRAQLFAAAMILYPIWYDPYRDCLCELEEVIDGLEARVRAWQEDRHGWQATGMRLWKRSAINGFFGSERAVRFSNRAPRDGRRHMVWANQSDNAPGAVRVEDGFLRSQGLGAQLVPPLSLVCDDLGIYYDPSRESRLDRYIAARAKLRGDQADRARDLIERITARGLSKYNQGGTLPELPPGRRILVPGQVEDDASILLGASSVKTNLALLQAARNANPDAVILFKPHPDVEAGLRPGEIDSDGLADCVLSHTDPGAILPQVDAVWTMTSTLGFEALLRGVEVVTLGTPFYAGWGLTRDLAPIPPWRRLNVSLEGLVHAVLVDYPRYRDPKTGLPCPVEVIVDRLSDGYAPSTPSLRILAKLQGIFAGFAHLWR
ncbi:capsular polysaccharide biosynthesis protein [Thalassobius vesicularis]|uniref:Capsular polysaccharide biosynthesis protein n=1 Tax=Thalassobius vesicularis TaxID=1294297 RepID=A0A4V3UZ82_9RHOB|nr:capsular polysaccharide biosynthesis protein [Thalassobius vesicularis]THD75709.1 capsular polysaccharide biosynthesis protein [Thalassobius vesicularis]